MWLHRAGFQWPNEPFTAHCRKRYRLTQSKNPGSPPCDPSLWIVHYSRAERENVVPSNQIPLQPHIQAALSQRRFLQTQGHLARKEFMLHDKANWPTINLPSAQGLHYPPHLIARRQEAAAQMQMGPSPVKAIPDRIQDRIQHRRGPSNALEPTLEEEEDVYRGDMLDFMSPRDISRMRYEQHHEWMEEIMSSPFAMKQILPTDLGLGRKGELEALTSGFFDTPTTVLQETPANASNVRVGRMNVGKAEEFTTKAAKKVAEMEAELENLKRRHARGMAKLDKSSSMTIAEKRLRTGAVEGARQSMFEDGETGAGRRVIANVDDIVREVEAATGKNIVPISVVSCVQKGGLEVKEQSTGGIARNGRFSPGKGVNKSHSNGSNTEALNGSARRSSPGPQQQQQQHLQPRMDLPRPSQPVIPAERHIIQQPVAAAAQRVEPEIPSLDDMDIDAEMAGIENADQQVGARAGEDDGSEWVLVDDMNGDIGKEDPPSAGQAQHQSTKQTTESPHAAAALGFANTPTGSGLQGLTPAEPSSEGAGEIGGMNADDFGLEHGDFDAHLDDSGEGLVDFGDEHGDLNLEGMDSAFGNAFHPPDESQGHLPDHGDMS